MSPEPGAPIAHVLVIEDDPAKNPPCAPEDEDAIRLALYEALANELMDDVSYLDDGREVQMRKRSGR